MNIDFAQTDVVFLGAGFSRAVTPKAPLVNDFFSNFDVNRYPRLRKFLDTCFDGCENANIETALHKLDQISLAPLRGVDSSLDECRANRPVIRAEFDRFVLDRLRDLPIPCDSWAAQVLAQCSSSTTVITTNYDVLAERILSGKAKFHRIARTDCHHCKMCAILEEGCSCNLKPWQPTAAAWRGSLLKIHGSIAWRLCTTADCASHTCLIPDEFCRPFSTEPCPCCFKSCSPALIAPTKLKTFERMEQLERMWDAATSALKDARSIALFGFSVPESDDHIFEWFKHTLGKSDRLEVIAILDIDTEGPLERLRKCLVHRNRPINIATFRVPKDRSKPEWLMELATA